MVNRFDTSIDKGYVSNYIPLPFQELQGMAAQQQKQYDTTLDDTYKLQDMMSTVPVINDPNLGLSNIAAKKSLDTKYSARIEDLTNRITKGNDFVGAQRDLNKLKREWTNDPDRIELENSFQNYKAYKEDKVKKAGKYDPLLDDYRGQSLYDDSTGLKPFRYSGMEDKLDIEKRFAETMDKIKEDTKEWDVESLGSEGIKIGSKGRAAGITSDKVLGLAKTKVIGVLTQTPEGQQFMKKYQKLNPNATQEDVINEGINLLFSSGAQQIFSDKASGNSVDVTSMWGTLRKESQDKEAQMASTTPEVLSLTDNNNTLPANLSKFYNNGEMDLGNRFERFVSMIGEINPAMKPALDLIKGTKLNIDPQTQAKIKSTGEFMQYINPSFKVAADMLSDNNGWASPSMNNKSSGSLNKKAIDYSTALFDEASKISGKTKTELAREYKASGNNGFANLQNYVESYYNNLGVQKNTGATFQNPEQTGATPFFLGPKITNKDQVEDAIGSNIRGSEITDMNGKIITDKKGINSNNYNVVGINFDKPGQIVLSGNDGNSLLMNTNYETLKKATQPVVDINKDAIDYLKTFKMSESNKKQLEKKYNTKINKAPTFEFNYNGQKIGGELIKENQYKINGNNIDASTIVTRVFGQPIALVNYIETDNDGNVIEEKTIPLEDFKAISANKIIANPEFRGINKQKENKVDFE